MTPAQRDALEWLEKRGGDGAFDRFGRLLAQGETAPVMRTTWNNLAKLGKVEFYNLSGKGRGRCRVINPAICRK